MQLDRFFYGLVYILYFYGLGFYFLDTVQDTFCRIYRNLFRGECNIVGDAESDVGLDVSVECDGYFFGLQFSVFYL